jgi:hypothetical protein
VQASSSDETQAGIAGEGDDFLLASETNSHLDGQKCARANPLRVQYRA